MRLTRPEAAHLLRRAAVGGTTGQIDRFVGMTRAAAVNKLFNTSVTPDLPFWRVFASGDDDYRAQTKMIEWWVDRMITSPPTIEEKLTLFLHGHFATGRHKVEDARLMWDQHRVFRSLGRGSFRTLLERVSLGSAMLIFIDNETNVVGAPQENFAREFMELHTVGNGNFTEADVVAMARAWTGHNTVGATRANNWVYDPTYVFKPEEHDNGQKTLFGIRKNWDAHDTLDEVCTGVKAQDTAEFFTRKMFSFYVHTNPSPAVITELANGFRRSGLNIGSLLRSILMHDEFWKRSTRYALVKSPAEYMVDIMRRNRLRSSNDFVRWRMERMGMVLFDPPTVAGWGQNDYWLSTATAWAKSEWVSNLKWGADDRNVLQNTDALSADQVVRRVLNFYSIFDASPSSRAQIKNVIEQTRDVAPWEMSHAPFAVGMFMPEVQCA